MLQRITRSVAAPLALFVWSAAAPPSRADFSLYVANSNSSPSVVKVSSDGTTSTFDSGFTSNGVATDSSGDVFISDASNGTIVELGQHGTTTYNVGGEPGALAYYNGNLYFINNSGSGFGSVEELNLTSQMITTISSTYGHYAVGLAIDASGNDVFVDDPFNSRVVELNSTNGNLENSFRTTEYITGLAISPTTGDLFVAGVGDGESIQEINPVPMGGKVVQTITGPFNSPKGLIFDSSGDLFVGDYDYSTSKIYEVSVTGIAAGASVGKTSTDGAMPFASGSLIINPVSLALYEPQEPSAAPEPSSLTLLGLGLASLAAYRWRRRRIA